MEDCFGSVSLPSMKDRQKRLCQERQKSRQRPIYDDPSNFGVRMLAKLGWSEGKGLGKNENGITVPVAQRLKRDNEGVGFVGGPDDQWTQHDAGFNELLKRLNGEADATSEECSNEFDPKAQLQSLEERSKTSRARVHYRKFTRGKDLSQANEKDLANIFGKRSLAEINRPAVVKKDSSESESEEESERPVLGLSTIKSSMSIQEYFKEKMKQKPFVTAGDKVNGTNETTSEEQRPNEEGLASVDAGKSKKKKNKRKYDENEEPLSHPVVQSTGANEEVKKAVAVEDVEIQVKPESELSSTKKKKKSKKQTPDPESSPIDATAEMANEEQDETVTATADEPARKKKKSKKSKLDQSEETNVVQEPEKSNSIKEKKEKLPSETLASDDVAREDGEVSSIAEEPVKKKKKSKKSQLDQSMENNAKKETVPLETPVTAEVPIEEPAKKKKMSKKSKSAASMDVTEESEETVSLLEDGTSGTKSSQMNGAALNELQQNGKDNEIEETQKQTTLQQNLPPSAELPPMEDEEELTCKVKVHVLKYLDESRFVGSNFGDIIGYRLTEQVKLIKNEGRAPKWKKRK